MRITKSVNLTKEMWQKLKEIADKNRRSVSGTVETIIKEYLEKGDSND